MVCRNHSSDPKGRFFCAFFSVGIGAFFVGIGAFLVGFCAFLVGISEFLAKYSQKKVTIFGYFCLKDFHFSGIEYVISPSFTWSVITASKNFNKLLNKIVDIFL